MPGFSSYIRILSYFSKVQAKFFLHLAASQPKSSSYSRIPPKPLLLLLQDVLQIRLVLGLAAGPRLVVHNARRFGLPHPLTGIGFNRFGSGESGWLAFRHG